MRKERQEHYLQNACVANDHATGLSRTEPETQLLLFSIFYSPHSTHEQT